MRLLLALIPCLVIAGPLIGQSPQPAFRHYSTDHGLPSPEVYDILEDRKGYIWVSTDNGVSRFNGYEFENFGPEQGLKNNVVLYLSQGREGRIWMSTLSGNLYVYQDSIAPFAYNDLLLNHRKEFQQVGITYEDAAGNLHIGLNGLGVLIVDPNGEERLLRFKGWGGYLLYKIEGETIPVFLTKAPKGKPRPAIVDSYRLPLIFYEDSIRQIHELLRQDYRPIFNRFEGGAFRGRYDFFSLGGIGFLFENESLIWSDVYPHLVITSFQNADNEIFIGHAIKGGARRYPGISSIPTNNYQEMLSGYSVSHIAQDRAGGYWFGTTENSIFYTPNIDYEIYNRQMGLSEEYITAVEVKNQGEVFIGLDNGEVYHLFVREKKLKKIYGHPEEDVRSQVFDLAYDPNSGRLWRAGSSLVYFDGGAWAAATIYKPSGEIDRPSGFANKRLFLNVAQNALWGCSSGARGFAKINAVSAKSEFSTSYLSEEVRGRTMRVFQDLNGRVWVGRIEGLFEWKSDSLKAYGHLHAGLQLRVEDITQMKDSTLVIGTKGGGILLWKPDQSFQQISTEQGLTASMTERVHVDEAQNIWVGTLNGLNLVELHASGNPTVTNITIADGLPSNEITDIDSKGDEIWVATTRGLARLPRIQSKNRESTLPVIEQVRINGKKIAIPSLSKIPFAQNNVEIRVLAINYKLNGQIKYRYRLQSGVDWAFTQNRSINFSALAPDNYAFEVQSQNEDGIWSESAFLHFEIRPPFWQTWWFGSIAVFLLTSIVYSLYQYRIQQVRKEAAFDKEVFQLKQLALRSQMNPHFIFNCLNSIQGFIASGDKANATRYLSRFARLVRSVLDSTQSNVIPLETDIQILENYLELEKMRFEDRFNYTIEMHHSIDPRKIRIPPLLIQPYVENAILHGLKERRRNGLIHIQYEKKGDSLLVSLRDNGVGFFQSQSHKDQSMTGHKSIGMTITHKRLKLLDQDPSDDKVKIEEVRDAEDRVIGTSVQLQIKTMEEIDSV